MPGHRPPRLVVGFDGSPEARRAVAVAARRAGRRGRVWVVHAHPSPPQLYDIVDRDRWHADHVDSAQALLDTLLLTGDAELLETNYERSSSRAAPPLAWSRRRRRTMPTRSSWEAADSAGCAPFWAASRTSCWPSPIVPCSLSRLGP